MHSTDLITVTIQESQILRQKSFTPAFILYKTHNSIHYYTTTTTNIHTHTKLIHIHTNTKKQRYSCMYNNDCISSQGDDKILSTLKMTLDFLGGLLGLVCCWASDVGLLLTALTSHATDSFGEEADGRAADSFGEGADVRDALVDVGRLTRVFEL